MGLVGSVSTVVGRSNLLMRRTVTVTVFISEMVLASWRRWQSKRSDVVCLGGACAVYDCDGWVGGWLDG